MKLFNTTAGCVHLSFFICIYVSIYLPIYLSIYLYFYLAAYLPIYLSIYLFIYLSTYISIQLPTCLFIYLSTSAPGHAGDAGGVGPAGPGHGEAQRRGPSQEVRLRGRVLQWYNLFIYRPFHKTLPRSSAFANQISVRFYETDCI